MSKVSDAEGLLLLGLVAGGVFLVYKVVGGAAALAPAVAKAVDPYELQATVDDASIARYVIDHPQGGYLQAARFFGPGAINQARQMPAGSGTAPPDGSYLASLFPPYSGVSGGW